MEVRLNSRTYGYWREDRTVSMLKEDKNVVRAGKMADKKQANQEAEDEMIKKLENAIYSVEGERAPVLMQRLRLNVLGMRMNPYGKLIRCIEELRQAGVDVETGFWETFIATMKNTISKKTDPNKFYTY